MAGILQDRMELSHPKRIVQSVERIVPDYRMGLNGGLCFNGKQLFTSGFRDIRKGGFAAANYDDRLCLCGRGAQAGIEETWTWDSSLDVISSRQHLCETLCEVLLELLSWSITVLKFYCSYL
ncbi:predicted protein [Histoplasma capsulatum G186AR]|uniref:Uncharacterized protein n=1 Tax=Ajellomyces capsulatus (strain G186AR / H82 / ATCC MYA-2454 / RMSCC 2432) TaxID=447093 RepID=C0P0C3_AJECG|nr:uncharacterized protein HCBG_08842 [Histoplasma capsulatum G186AR]EEH02939.1 predicted protein [Histoplasma capsulatum G186AR]